MGGGGRSTSSSRILPCFTELFPLLPRSLEETYEPKPLNGIILTVAELFEDLDRSLYSRKKKADTEPQTERQQRLHSHAFIVPSSPYRSFLIGLIAISEEKTEGRRGNKGLSLYLIEVLLLRAGL